jgi:hypothetical protein
MGSPRGQLHAAGVIAAGLALLSAVAGCSRLQQEFHPPAVADKEVCRYEVSTSQYGVKAPAVEVGIEKLPNGQIRISESMYGAQLVIDSKTLLPVHADIHQRSKEGETHLIEEFLADGRVNVTRQAPLSSSQKTINPGAPAFHFHELFLLFRSLDLVPGNSIAFSLYSPYSQEKVRARMTVAGLETVTIRNRTEPAYRLNLQFSDLRVTVWLGEAAPHKILKFTNGVMDLDLVECSSG